MTLFLLAASLCLSIAASPAAGDLVVDEIASKAIARTVKLNVLLPDGYAEAVDHRFPAVYLLHGLGGDYTEWQRVGVVEEAKGLAAIIVMPEGDQSFYVNHHEQPDARWEDYVTKEVIAHVDAKYRTIASREGRAASGLSMGGYGAVALGLKHPELFASVASHSGALGVVARPASGRIGDVVLRVFGPEGSETRKLYDPVALAAKLAEGNRPHLYLDCGSSDFLLDDNRSFVRELAKLGLEYEYREVPGQHDFAYWKRNVRYSLSKQLEALDAAAKSKAAKAAAVARPADATGSAAAVATVDGVVGEWDLVIKFGEEASYDYTLKIEKKGAELKAVQVSPRSGEHPFKSAAVVDGKLRLVIERDIQGNDVTFEFEGKPGKEGLEGTAVAKGFEDQLQITWTATRKKATPQK
jgi:S-formylglutathione hydrolase FrmB